MIAEWQSFSIGAPETVNFYQPSASSIALNRVVGINPSQIFGALNANGQVFLVNTSGIVFSPSASVDVNGLLASTLDISNADFMNGNYSFYGFGGSVINQGTLSAPGGYVALLGATVKNTGLITVELGSVVLASGEAITLGLDAQNMITVVVDAATTQSLSGADDAVLNAGTISAKGGKVILTAKALNGIFDNAINNVGLIEASSLNSVNGQVVLEANQRVNVAGEINVVGGTVIVNSEGADFSGIINAADGYYNMHGGDTNITGGTYIGNSTWLDDINIFLASNVKIVNGNATILADRDTTDAFDGYVSISADLLLTNGDAYIEGASVYLNAGSSVKSNSGNIELVARNLTNSVLAEVLINGVVTAENGDVDISSTGDVKHGTNGDVSVKNGDFTGYAGQDYIMEDGSSIIVQEGVINIEALRDIILGAPGLLASDLEWEYISGSRGYKLVEIGYYYVNSNGDVVEVPFPGASSRVDIGKDAGIESGSAAITNATDLGFYVIMYNGTTLVGTFYTNPALNTDMKDHVSIDSNGAITVFWEDQFNLGDRDYNDVVISYAPVGDGDLLFGVHLYSIFEEGTAEVVLNAGQDIKANRAHLNALVNGEGHAEVDMDAGRDILMANSTVLAEVGSGEESAIITANALGSIRHRDTMVRAVNNSEGNAHIIYDAVNEIELDHSLLKAETNAGGTEDWDDIAAVVSLETVRGDIILKGSGSDVIAQVNNSGKALAQIDAGDDAIINHSRVKALVGGEGHAEVDLSADRDVTLTDSLVRAETGSGAETALVKIHAGDDIDLINSDVEAEVFGDGIAVVKMMAGDNVNIDETSTVSATTEDGFSGVLAMAGGAIDNQGQVSATSTDGYAGVGMLAIGDIYAGDITAQGGLDADAIAELEGLIAGWPFYFPIDIGAQFGYSSGILLGSLNGDITLGDLTADAVLVAALGLDGYADIIDEGDVVAHYLGMLARNNIGTAENPIYTDVDILSAYSWDEGHIYINEANDIELGLYLPVYGMLRRVSLQVFEPGDDGPPLLQQEVEPEFFGAIGASVAANNGLIHIVSEGDMLVNSIIAPNGGVYLRTNTGSIYAGQGWDPAVDQSLVDWLGEMAADRFGCNPWHSFDSEDASWIIGEALMALAGTPLESTGVDYFSPVMWITPDRLTENAYNVIAGGYSYFKATQGTIGVGTPDDSRVYNPLQVYIDAGPDNSVLPGTGFVLPPTTIGTPGLILYIGGVVPDDDPNNPYPYPGITHNGPIGMSGAIAGMVRPGDMAVTYVFPSPGIDVQDGGPEGYVFYDDYPAGSGPLQIWPSYAGAVPYLLEDDTRTIYYEKTQHYRIASFEPATPATYYAYHPLSTTDSSAFDDIVLDAAAYEFIDGNLNMKDKLAPYFGE